MPLRVVRFAPVFFRSLDELLPEGRTAEGFPSATDFLMFDLPPARDLLAADFEGCTVVVPPGGMVRVFIGVGLLVPYFALFALLAGDGAVEVLDIAISNE